MKQREVISLKALGFEQAGIVRMIEKNLDSCRTRYTKQNLVQSMLNI